MASSSVRSVSWMAVQSPPGPPDLARKRPETLEAVAAPPRAASPAAASSAGSGVVAAEEGRGVQPPPSAVPDADDDSLYEEEANLVCPDELGPDEEHLVCPDEGFAIAPRLRLPSSVPPSLVPQAEAESWSQAARALEVDDRDSGWNGPVAIERSDGPRPPLTAPRSLVGPFSGVADQLPRPDVAHGSRIETARQHLRTALLALEEFDPLARDCDRLRDGASVSRREAAARAAELTEARAEACQLRRENMRLRGRPAELAVLPTGALHTLQQELSDALANVHAELESRTKCCVCREVERQVLLLPCQHLALCSACSRRVDRCPLCRSCIERCEVAVVA